ncbi:hypothetical protein [Brevibacillus fulvus]|uniref:Uncharacterized protein n=1 Tax=Brevibacillus fulvus TaxID=1125967 RepID=A0A939BN59_9BACL|nr:hypothetical protein [Brevibacillus fulvus]MBM7588450.1 hypothetical protein [Brevibacillus fulvus]
MEIHSHQQLLQLLREQFAAQAEISFTQWDTEGEDEEETQFHGRLLEVTLTDNQFGEKDLWLQFETDGDKVEILMELPAEETDLGSVEEEQLRIFGTEAELVLTK